MDGIKYVTNHDLLVEIHRSKVSYCWFGQPEHARYDMIVSSLDELTPDSITLRGRRRNPDGAPQKAVLTEAGQRTAGNMVLRVMTNGHVPIDESRRRRSRPHEDVPARTNFPPFKHVVWDSTGWVEVGRSHWCGDPVSGQFAVNHGRISRRLADMFMLLVNRYSSRRNWRNYCVCQNTEALTQRGWLTHDQITTGDLILSFDGTRLAWSPIRAIYRNHYQGQMFHLTGRGLDALITPGHKVVTDSGLKPVELLLAKDRVVLGGDSVAAPDTATYPDAFVELVGWVVTEGCVYRDPARNYPRIDVFQNEGAKADRIRACALALGKRLSESRHHPDKPVMRFNLDKRLAQLVAAVIEIDEKVLTMEFILSLTQRQRELLIDTMIDGDGYRGVHTNYTQRSKRHMDAFVTLCTLAGKRVSVHHRDIVSFGKPTRIFICHVFAPHRQHASVANIDFHGGKRRGSGLTKQHHPNQPTVDYDGMVWCPQTDYGCFVARRNGKVYLTGNSYVDEMRSLALLQLSQIALQFDENKSDNPFAFYTTTIRNCFTRVLNLERRNQRIRDDLLIIAGAAPSYSRQVEHELEQKQAEGTPSGPTEAPGKRPRPAS